MVRNKEREKKRHIRHYARKCTCLESLREEKSMRNNGLKAKKKQRKKECSCNVPNNDNFKKEKT